MVSFGHRPSEQGRVKSTCLLGLGKDKCDYLYFHIRMQKGFAMSSTQHNRTKSRGNLRVKLKK